jgi:hypothetical protein
MVEGGTGRSTLRPWSASPVAIGVRRSLPFVRSAIGAPWLLESGLRPLIGLARLAGMTGLPLPFLLSVPLILTLSFVLVRHGSLLVSAE